MEDIAVRLYVLTLHYRKSVHVKRMGTRSPLVASMDVGKRPGITAAHLGHRPSRSVAFATANPRRRITASPHWWQ
jgi:hypothetical protein